MEDEKAGKVVATGDEGGPYYYILGESILKGLVESFNTLRGVRCSFLAIYLYFYFGLHAVYSNRIAHAGLYYKTKLSCQGVAVRVGAFSPADRERGPACLYTHPYPYSKVVFGSANDLPVEIFPRSCIIGLVAPRSPLHQTKMMHRPSIESRITQISR